MKQSKHSPPVRFLIALVTLTCAVSLSQTTVSVLPDLSGNLASIGPSAGTPPTVVGQPLSGVARLGKGVSWTTIAAGSLPLFYQWQLNSNNIPGATADTLSVLSVAQADFGAYRVIISNTF